MVRRSQRGWSWLLAALWLGAFESTVVAQTEVPSAQPYASMDREKVSYHGAGRENGKDIRGEAVSIGILLPLSGKRAAEGELLRKAAQIAIDEENRAGGPANGRRFVLAVQDESGQWGQASSAMVHLVMHDEAVALITSTDGSIAHQAEQIANKIGIPVITLSSDPTTTRINIPWIFRVGPSDVEQARAMAAQIYGVGADRKVLLITETGHDGGIGGEEFLKAAKSYRAGAPERLEIDAGGFSATVAAQEISARRPEAVVVWAGAELARQLVLATRETIPTVPIYLCQKAADFLPALLSGDSQKHSAIFTMGTKSLRRGFAKQYQEVTGQAPGIAAQELNDAVGAIAAAVRRGGSNRARVRDELTRKSTGGSEVEVILFDAAGNGTEEASWAVVEVQPDKGFLTTVE